MNEEEKKKKLEALKGLLKEFRANLDAYDTPDLGGVEKGILQNTSSHLNKIQINLFALSDQVFKKEMGEKAEEKNTAKRSSMQL